MSHGIGQVMPWRKRHKAITRREDKIAGVIDEHGVPYCTHCGAAGTTITSGGGYEIKDGIGYLRFRCTNPHTLKCRTAM